MLPEAKHENLLYVSNGNSSVTVFSYRHRVLVGTLTGFTYPAGECSDVAGDVFITDYSANTITEYAHGAAQPLRTLQDPGGPSIWMRRRSV
jgi:hypothetical protein